MAKQRILESNGNLDRRDYIVAEFNHGGQRREDISAALGFANSRAMYNALVTQGWVVQEKREPSNNGDDEPKPRRAKGVLPKEIERWAILSAQADFIRDGNDPDDFVHPAEITPDWFFSLRAVRDETPAFVDKALSRIGGLDSEAGRALRQWAGQPLTSAQAARESAERESAAQAAIMPKIARLLEKARALAAQSGLPIEDRISRVMNDAGMFEDDSWREKPAS